MNVKPISKAPASASRYAWIILAVAFLASVAAPFNQFKVPPIMPVLIDAFEIDLTQAGLLMSAIAIIGLGLALPAGIILERVGARAAGLAALGFMAAGTALGALSPSYLALMASRVTEGIGIGLIGVVAPAIIAAWFPSDRLGIPMGIWATGVPLGSLSISIFGPPLVAARGWQAVWWAGTGFALLLFVIYAAFIRQPPGNPSMSTPDSDPIPLRRALSNRDIWLLAALFGCFNLGVGSISTFYPTFLHQVRGYPLNQAALISSITTALVMFAAPVAGWVSDRIGSRRQVFSIPFLLIAVLLLFPFRVTGWHIMVLMMFQGLIFGAVPTATFAAVTEVMGNPRWVGLGVAVVTMGQYAGMLLGPVLFGELVSRLGWVTSGYLMIPVCLSGYLCARMVRVR